MTHQHVINGWAGPFIYSSMGCGWVRASQFCEIIIFRAQGQNICFILWGPSRILLTSHTVIIWINFTLYISDFPGRQDRFPVAGYLRKSWCSVFHRPPSFLFACNCKNLLNKYMEKIVKTPIYLVKIY